jgi:hypothetical protein
MIPSNKELKYQMTDLLRSRHKSLTTLHMKNNIVTCGRSTIWLALAIQLASVGLKRTELE